MNIRVLQIGSDRSKRGILFPHTPAAKRQAAFAEALGDLDIIAFSLASDNARPYIEGALRVYPTDSPNKLLYGYDALRIMKHLHRPTVISAQDPFEVGLLALLIARTLGIPLHVQVHTDFLAKEFIGHSILNRLRSRVARTILKRADGIRVVSRRIKDSLKTKNLELKTIPTVLPIFADVDAIRTAEVDTVLAERFARFKTKVLFVGRFEPEKNPCLAIRSFAAVAPADACLIMVGDGSERAHLEAQAEEHGVRDRVFFEGLQEAVRYYPIADLVLVTSHYEGYGLVVIEGLAAGKPVLSTDVGVAHEAGAIISSAESFTDALGEWFKSGPRTAELKNYPYRNFEEYIAAFAEDISCAIRVPNA